VVDREKIRPAYAELQGILGQLPNKGYVENPAVWTRHNALIQELNDLTGRSYDGFRLASRESTMLGNVVEYEEYRMKLAGLVGRLHAEYFSDEPPPFVNMPSTMITQTQSQSVQVEVLLEINTWISDKLNQAKEGSPERKFLERVRGAVSKVRSVGQFVSLLLTTAKEFGLSIDQLKDLLS